MKKLFIALTFIILSTPALAGCGEWERSALPPFTSCKNGWVQMCIGGQWQWVCY